MIELLLDQGLPRRAAADLRALGWLVEHTGEVGLAMVTDAEIVEYATAHGLVVVTLDSDFARLVAMPQRKAPSLIHIRIPRVSRGRLFNLLKALVPVLELDLVGGAIVSVTEAGARVRRLPVG